MLNYCPRPLTSCKYTFGLIKRSNIELFDSIIVNNNLLLTSIAWEWYTNCKIGGTNYNPVTLIKLDDISDHGCLCTSQYSNEIIMLFEQFRKIIYFAKHAISPRVEQIIGQICNINFLENYTPHMSGFLVEFFFESYHIHHEFGICWIRNC